MKSWQDFSKEEPDLAGIGRKILFSSRPNVGYAFIATLRRDGAPRLHPISVVICNDRLYIIIPTSSPKYTDLIRDGRYALQAFPPIPNNEWEEFYLAGQTDRIEDPRIRQRLIQQTKIAVEADEVLFELFLDRVMYTKLVDIGTADERPIHKKWRLSALDLS